MAASNWTLTDAARSKILDGTFILGTGPWKCALFTSASNLGAASTAYSGVTNEVAAANGYTTGGVDVAFTLSGTTSVNISFTANPTWAASGGSIVARYAAIYKTGGDVLAYSLLDNTPADVTTAAGSVLQIDSDGTPNPFMTAA